MPNENLPPDFLSLLHVFNTIFPLTNEIQQVIISQCEIEHVKKKTLLLRAGQTNNTIYFINSGAARVYYLDKEGVETTSWFLFENELLISVYSFFTGQPGFEYFETLEDCTFVTLSREKLNKLYDKYMEMNFIGRKLTEYYYIRNEIQTNELRMLTAKQRYLKLIEHNPQIINRVSLGHIASYLGISQETLSRIRKQI